MAGGSNNHNSPGPSGSTSDRLGKAKPAATPTSTAPHTQPPRTYAGAVTVVLVPPTTTVLRQTRLDEVWAPIAPRVLSADGRSQRPTADAAAAGGGGRSRSFNDIGVPPSTFRDFEERPSVNNARLDEASLSRDPNRAARAMIADETLEAIMKDEKYPAPEGRIYDLKELNDKMETKFFGHNDRRLANWEDKPVSSTTLANVSFRERSTIESARDWVGRGTHRVGVLNFASAKKRGGGFKNGAQAQEESIARASNLYRSLSSAEADPFYLTHLGDDMRGFYSHSMLYTKNVALIRDHQDQWAPPVLVDIVTSAAVNAGSVRSKATVWREEDWPKVESNIESAMFDRMGRILKLFEDRKDKVLILGSFGTGVFQNSITVVARCWAELLGPGGRFSSSFEQVEFAILGGPTFREFKLSYEATCSHMLAEAMSKEEPRL